MPVLQKEPALFYFHIINFIEKIAAQSIRIVLLKSV